MVMVESGSGQIDRVRIQILPKGADPSGSGSAPLALERGGMEWGSMEWGSMERGGGGQQHECGGWVVVLDGGRWVVVGGGEGTG